MRKRLICIDTACIDIKSDISYNANNKGGNTMKKLLSITMTALLMLGLGTLGCSHVHTEECGENGINCTHECHHIVPYDDEEMPN